MTTSPGSRATVMLVSTTVTSGFRDELFAAAAASGLTPSDFCLIAAAHQLRGRGRRFPGIFKAGDFPDLIQPTEQREHASQG